MQVAGKQMVGVYLTVWVHKRMLERIRGVQATSVYTGMRGLFGNKGTPCLIVLLCCIKYNHILQCTLTWQNACIQHCAYEQC